MVMMKRWIAVLLAVLMSAMMWGCKKDIPVEEEAGAITQKDSGAAEGEAVTNEEASGPEETGMVPEEGAKLVFWTADTEFGKEAAKRFEAEYGVPVAVEEVGLGAVDKIALSGPTGTGADVFMCPNDSFQHGVSAGLFLELEDKIADGIRERINEVGVKTVSYEDKLYGIPLSLETSCLFYNKDLVGEQPADTLEEIIEQAKEFNDPEKNKFQLLVEVGDGYKVYPFLSACGFELFGAEGADDENPGFDTDAFEKGLELVSGLKEIMPINSVDLGNDSFLNNQFIEGKVAYEISGPWNITTFKDSGVNFGVTELPTYNGKPMLPFVGIQSAHVSAFTLYPNAAQLFAQYLVSDESAAVMYEKANKLTTLRDISKIPGLSEDEILQPFVKQFEHSFPMPSASRISYYWTISAQTCQAVFDGQLTPAEGRKKAVEDWNTLLSTE
jgi:arabinogalactan oligomer/maltooligosaccharide transport system substrate-binding protein